MKDEYGIIPSIWPAGSNVIPNAIQLVLTNDMSRIINLSQIKNY